MKTLNIMLSNLSGRVIPIGYEGENMYTRIRINCIEVFSDYPDATVGMVVSPPVGDMYPAVVEKSGVMVIWDITDAVLSSNGSGECQLTFTEGDVVRKSVVFGISINRSLIASGEMPDPIADWVVAADKKLGELDGVARDETDEWLTEHITNPDSPPLDRTLTSSVSAAPADMVGDLKSAIEGLKNETEGNENYTENCYISSSGELVPDSGFCVSDFVALQGTGKVVFYYGTHTYLKTRLVFFNNSGVALDDFGGANNVAYREIPVTSIPSGATKMRFSFVKGYDGKIVENGITTYEATVSGGLINDVAEMQSQVAHHTEEIAEINDIIYTGTDNYYDRSIQTPGTISPHYYYNGVPYETTQFDTSYNCTALIPVEPLTQYSIALIPAINSISKPWNNAPQGVFYYGSDGTTYIDKTNVQTFTTPANCYYIRFNYAIGSSGVTLDELNSACVLVKGSTLPVSYIPYTASNIREDINKISEQKASKPIWVRVTGTTVDIGRRYDADRNIVVTMSKHGNNNIFDFHMIRVANCLIPFDDLIENDYTILAEASSDWFSPYIVAAVNNIDGDAPSSNDFTGGNHSYTNSSGTATGRTASITVFADGVPVDSGESAYCSSVLIDWENYIQGYNTKKSDGTGREILKAKHSATFTGEKIEVTTNIYPLEDVIMKTFYGFQGYTKSAAYQTVRYIGSANRGANDGETATDSGDIHTYEAHCTKSTTDMMRLSIDPLYDLGKRDNGFVTGNRGMFTTTAKKIYFTIINTSVSMSSGDLYVLHGEYEFVPIR